MERRLEPNTLGLLMESRRLKIYVDDLGRGKLRCRGNFGGTLDMERAQQERRQGLLRGCPLLEDLSALPTATCPRSKFRISIISRE
ncbi:hypothetical protein CRG98_034412 [Punica granatum]|uniref:Uncharacterized protein n=1 Tax=Punica granatum TaxID=22663 RepID=A0A2I0IMF1_PUNGR|nr:hypothetical protein CRG98_034412 [Punica granatum]